MPLPLFHSVFEDAHSSQTLVLLHGTGGDEYDLLPIGRQLRTETEQGSSPFNLLSLRGNLQESGMNRFFARKALGVFDLESIYTEAAKLARFLDDWLVEHAQTTHNLTYLGFSNGANMILALAFLHPELVSKAVLLHPMLPFVPDQKLDLTGKQFLVTYGQEDPMVSAKDSQELVQLVQEYGAEVSEVALAGGHQLSRQELEQVALFLN